LFENVFLGQINSSLVRRFIKILSGGCGGKDDHVEKSAKRVGVWRNSLRDLQ
jgi:hypothetical protein